LYYLNAMLSKVLICSLNPPSCGGGKMRMRSTNLTEIIYSLGC
jgi:hypothetical protein